MSLARIASLIPTRKFLNHSGTQDADDFSPSRSTHPAGSQASMPRRTFVNAGGYSSRNRGTDDVSYLRPIDNHTGNGWVIPSHETAKLLHGIFPGALDAPVRQPFDAGVSVALGPLARGLASEATHDHQRHFMHKKQFELIQCFAIKRIFSHLQKCLTWRTPPARSWSVGRPPEAPAVNDRVRF